MPLIFGRFDGRPSTSDSVWRLFVACDTTIEEPRVVTRSMQSPREASRRNSFYGQWRFGIFLQVFIIFSQARYSSRMSEPGGRRARTQGGIVTASVRRDRIPDPHLATILHPLTYTSLVPIAHDFH
ncbi:hypothetical protein ARMSODRAFT_455935 [Armillaria solidipes]|uniref:Uncharacterized protein n=1 Tax=Armillaria solidipes TaxID=1076256 RepID=A0A2H3BNH4_9AGAR|nr:hypothetical protein ARMSODRAFT_455935 [Armillaria solidipes]